MIFGTKIAFYSIPVPNPRVSKYDFPCRKGDFGELSLRKCHQSRLWISDHSGSSAPFIQFPPMSRSNNGSKSTLLIKLNQCIVNVFVKWMICYHAYHPAFKHYRY